MTTINAIKASVKPATLLKSGLLGLVAAAGMGLMTLPAKADQINQDVVNTTKQRGRNTAVTQTRQNASINKDVSRGRHYQPHYRYSLPDVDVINQGADTLTDQDGGNTAVTQTEQDADISEE